MKDLQAHNELEEISPFLAGLKKQNPFQLPVNYFTFLPDEIKKRVHEDSLTDELSGFDFFKKQKTHAKPSLEIPEGYFEKLPAIVLQKAKKQSETPKKKGIEIAFRRYSGIAVAASVAAMLFLGMTLFHPTYKIETSATTLNQEDINQYIRQNITEFDEQIIASQAGETNTTAMQPLLIENADDSSSYSNYLRDASGIDMNEINNLQNN